MTVAGTDTMPSWLLLQLADSAFPAGGFAHSAGLEAAMQMGEAKGAEGTRAFLEQALWQAGYGALPFVRAVHERAAHENAGAMGELDAHCHAFLTSEVANRASRTAGRALLATCAEVFDSPEIAALDTAVRRRELHAHQAPVIGAVTRALGIDCEPAQRLTLHLTLRGVASAAVRLGMIGPHEAQRIQHRMAGVMDRVLATCGALPVDEAAQPAPLLDLFGSLHGRLYARLFLS
ncbi:MAG: urease accessory UreF family protein [Polyangiaceae bacterium]